MDNRNSIPDRRRPLTEAEIARRKAEAARRRYQAEMKRRDAKRKARQRIITAIFLVMTMVTMLIGVGMFAFWKSFTKTESIDKSRIVYRYGGENSTEIVSYSRASADGMLLVNFTKVAEMLDMSSVGTASSIRYVVRSAEPADGSEGTGKEEYVIFSVGSNLAVVNGVTIRMNYPTEKRDSGLWVTSEFITDHMYGVAFTYSAKEGTVQVSRMISEGSTGDGIKYSTVAFVEKPTNQPSKVSEEGVTVPTPEFTADLSAYEEYMNPSDYDEYLILANKTTTLDASYVPVDLYSIADTRKDGRDNQQLRYYAAKALEALFIEMRAEGMTDYNQSSGQSVSVMSGYRSYAYQEYLFNSYITQEKAAAANNGITLTDAEAKAIVLTYSAYPGTSEHQTGLCVDMHNLPSASEAYKREASYEWLCENAWKFGFILRYPENKTAITGYDFEPWHWRYVGREAAYTIHENGMCLEEYLDGIKK